MRPDDHEITVQVTIEVKAGATIRTDDLAGLRNLAGHRGDKFDKFAAGHVRYTGQQTLSYGGRIKALPMTRSGSLPHDGRWSAGCGTVPAACGRVTGKHAGRSPGFSDRAASGAMAPPGSESSGLGVCAAGIAR
jgi:hypothetical protein